MTLSFHDLREANSSRVVRWHTEGKRKWLPSDWSNASAGEMGEVCNAVKKLMRIRDDLPNLSQDPSRQLSTEAEAKKYIAKEAADTVIYLDLLLADLGVSLGDAVRDVFNKKSEEYGFPERL